MEQTLTLWHALVASGDPAGLDEVLADDCVFISPILHTPQQGKDLARFYLTGAMHVFNDSFHYVKEVIADNHAVLEFNCTVDDVVINGVDIMTFDEEGKICEFKVMLRPLKGMQMMQTKMMAMLDAMSGREQTEQEQSAKERAL
ncbi:MAG: nuclear transport factor 2 family protein [Pseudomonadota bacterium]